MGKKILKNKVLLLMLVPAVAYVVIFSYLPMGGIVLAFKNYKYADGILGIRTTDVSNLTTADGHAVGLDNRDSLSTAATKQAMVNLYPFASTADIDTVTPAVGNSQAAHCDIVTTL